MNRLTIIGNLTKIPELRTTQNGKSVCSFSVAVNRRGKDAEVDYFNVSVWNALGESCAKYLDKGRKVCVVGSVSVRTYQGSDGKTRAVMDVVAQDVEFLSGREKQETHEEKPERTEPVSVEVGDELPF